ncbi:MAG: hypothetical protein ACRDP6_44475 [Actinoallomurus sp.]
MAVDIERFSAYDAREQLRARTELTRILSVAAQNTGLDQREWYEQVSGDGELVVLPEDVDIPTVVGDFTSALKSVVGEANRRVEAGRGLRLRIAMHHGTLTPGPFGPAGDAPIVVSRLLDSRPLRRLLAENHDRDVALIVSHSLYQDVIRTGFCALEPEEFKPIRVNAKGVQYLGFVQAPGLVKSSSPSLVKSSSPSLVEASSLGTAAARHIRSTADPDAVAVTVARVREDRADGEEITPFAGNASDGRKFSKWLVTASS